MSERQCRHEHAGMDKSAKPSDGARGLLQYWTALCAVLLVVIVVYAVFTAG